MTLLPIGWLLCKLESTFRNQEELPYFKILSRRAVIKMSTEIERLCLSTLW